MCRQDGDADEVVTDRGDVHLRVLRPVHLDVVGPGLHGEVPPEAVPAIAAGRPVQSELLPDAGVQSVGGREIGGGVRRLADGDLDALRGMGHRPD